MGAKVFGANPTTQLDQERSQWQTRIQEASDSQDPLAPWLEYYEWAKESFPTSRKEQLQVVQSATKLFRNTDTYKQDSRYLRLWIIYADMLSNPGEMFQYLSNKEIGTEHALFYRAHALILESEGKYKEADESFKLGIHRNVHELDTLQHAHTLFTERMVERVRLLQQRREEKKESASERTSSRSSRTGSSRESRGSSQRSGLSHTGASKTLSYSTMPQINVRGGSNRVLSVLRDDDNSLVPAPMDEIKVKWDEFATEEHAQKENVRAAVAWTGKTLPQSARSVRPPTSKSFSVYIDPDCIETPDSPPNDNDNDLPGEDEDYL